MRRDDDRAFWIGMTAAIILLLVVLLSSCALWELGTPVKPKPLRPCVGTFVYPDSASVCADTTGGR